MKHKISKIFRQTGNGIAAMMCLSALPVCLSGCSDWFDIMPQTELVKEDFWKSKSDVESAVAACYRAMEEPDVMERLIAWGEVRSDNVIRGFDVNNDILYMLQCNIDATNRLTSWSSIYSVINYCNTVIDNAPQVCEQDPNFTQGELRTYLAEAQTIRALCYFYLVRTFKDVPFITEPYTDNSRPFLVAQTDGNEIIDWLLKDLEDIQTGWARPVFANNADTKGRVTQKTLLTLMADMYLWRNDYEKCIETCHHILNTTSNPLQLETSMAYNLSVFGTGNSNESIFELQFDTDTPNYVLNEMYGWQGGRSSVNHLSAADFTLSENTFLKENSDDIRKKDAWDASNTSGTMVSIMKYIAHRTDNSGNQVSASDYILNQNTQHWIIYRLSDVYLMLAEALVERNSSQTDLDEAYEMVCKTYDRAHPSRQPGSLNRNNYDSQEKMRDLVFDERQIEFLFEGKRYFDLLRRIRRNDNLTTIVSKYLLPKYIAQGQDQATVTTKLNTLNALYLPINRDELRVNTLLEQNPFYDTASDIEKK